MSPSSVSVVVATRDRPDLLRRTLAGIEAQDLAGDVECIVVFDQAEPDRTIEGRSTTASGFARSVRVVTNERTAGLAGARNTGVAHATGEFVAFCDDDDVWLPTKLGKQVRVMDEQRTDTCVTGITIRYGERSNSRVPAESDMTAETLVRRRVMEAHPSSVVVRRSAFLESIGEVDEQIPGGFGEDYDWIVRAAEHGRISVVPEPLVMVRWGTHSFFNRDWDTIIAALDFLVDKHPAFAADDRALARIRGQQAFAYAAKGDRAAARSTALTAARLDPREKRTYVALLASAPGVRPEWILRSAHRFGRGV